MTAVFLSVEEYMNSSNSQDILLDKEGTVWKKQKTFFGEGLLPVQDVSEGCANIATTPAFVSKINKKIPYIFLQQIVRFFVDVSNKKYQSEAMIQIFYHIENEEYVLYCPEQSISKTRVSYQQNSDFTSSKDYIYVMDIHSHNTMSAFFSGTDDANEQETRLYGVVGRVDKETPDILLRSSMEGNFTLLPLSTAFELPEGYQLENLPFPDVSYPKEWMEAIDFSRPTYTAPWVGNSNYGSNKFSKPKFGKSLSTKDEKWDYFDSWSDPFAFDEPDDDFKKMVDDAASDNSNQLELFSNSIYERVSVNSSKTVKKDAPDWLAGSLAAKKTVTKTTTTVERKHFIESFFDMSDAERELVDYNSSFGIEPDYPSHHMSDSDAVKFMRDVYNDFLNSKYSHVHVLYQRVARKVGGVKKPDYRYYIVTADSNTGQHQYESGPLNQHELLDEVIEFLFDNMVDYAHECYPNSIYYVEEFLDLLDFADGDYGEFFDLSSIMKVVFFTHSDFVTNYALSKIGSHSILGKNAEKPIFNSENLLNERPFRLEAISLLSGEGMVARQGYRVYRQDEGKDSFDCKTIAYSESFEDIMTEFSNVVDNFLTFVQPIDSLYTTRFSAAERAKGYVVNEVSNHYEGNTLSLDVLVDYNHISKPVKFNKNIPLHRMVSREIVDLTLCNHTFL